MGARHGRRRPSVSPEGIVQSFQDERIRYYRIAHAGKGAALNRGAAESRAGLLCFLDQDDIMLPGRLCLQAAVFDAEPATEVVYSDYERVTDAVNGSADSPAARPRVRNAFDGWPGGSPSSRCRRSCSEKTCTIKSGDFPRTRTSRVRTTVSSSHGFLLPASSSATNRGCPAMGAPRAELFAGAPFQEARLVFLRHLAAMAEERPQLKGVLPLFRHNTYYMRGLYYLEHAMPDKACPEFIRAIGCNPASWNASTC